MRAQELLIALGFDAAQSDKIMADYHATIADMMIARDEVDRPASEVISAAECEEAFKGAIDTAVSCLSGDHAMDVAVRLLRFSDIEVSVPDTVLAKVLIQPNN